MLPADSSARMELFRIVAAEAHSWATLMIETESGSSYILAVPTGLMTAVDAGTAQELLETRAFRPWRGDRSWSSIDRLPVTIGGLPFDTAMPSGDDSGNQPAG